MLAVIAIACDSTTPVPTPRPPSPTVTPPSPPTMAGRWDDPDTPGTVTTIEERNGEFVVVSVINPDRGTNELTWSRWENGVLSWEYCPPDMYCITSETVDVTEDTLIAEWYWSDGGNGGTTYFERLP